MTNLFLSHQAAEALETAIASGQFGTLAAEGFPGAQYRGGQLSMLTGANRGIAVIDISGATIYDKSIIGSFLATMFGATLTPELQSSLRAAKDDPTISGVLLKFNTPGGMVDGTEESGRLIAELGSAKPTVALVESVAASAGYWKASAASKIIAGSRTAAVGSVGAVMQMRKKGDSTFEIVSSQSPKKRPDASTDAGRAQLQNYIDNLAQVFVENVAANRGKTVAQVLSDFGQGDMLLADQALKAGMIDQIGTEADAISLLRSMAGTNSAASKQKFKGASMNGTTANAGEGTTLAPTHTAETESKAVAAAVTAERARISGIIDSPEGKAHPTTALRLAMKTGMSVEEATAVLSGLPAETANPLSAAMNGVKNPPIQSGEAGAAGEAAETDALVARGLALAGGAKSK